MSGVGPADARKDRFEDRLFEWAREESAHELASDFARLRALRGRSAQGAVAYMDESDDATCRELARAMLLRFHPAASARAGLAATPAQQRLFEVANLRRLDLTTHLPPARAPA